MTKYEVTIQMTIIAQGDNEDEAAWAAIDKVNRQEIDIDLGNVIEVEEVQQ